MSALPSYLWLSRHSIFYFRIVVPDVLRLLFPCAEIRRSLQTRCKREALIRGRELLLQVQRLYTQAFQGVWPCLDALRGGWEAGGKRVASWASWLRQQQLVEMAAAGASWQGQSGANSEVGQGGAAEGSQKLRRASTRASSGQGMGCARFAQYVSSLLQDGRGVLGAAGEQEGVSTKTIDDKRSVTSLLVRIIGDMPIDLITRQDARKFRETALKLPPRLNQLPEGLVAWAGCSPSIELG